MTDVATIREFWQSQRKNAKILIVDDEPAICEALAMTLEDFELASVTAWTGEVACLLLEKEHFDLVITDKNLPIMSGLDLLAHIRDHKLDVPAIMMTGYASISTVALALDAGAIDYLAKPFDDVFTVGRKLAALVDKQVHLRVYERIAQSLLSDVRDRQEDKALAGLVGEKLARFKSLMSRSPELLLFDGSEGGRKLAADLADEGLRCVVVDTLDDALVEVDPSRTLRLAMVSLDQPNALDVIFDLKQSAGDLTIIAATHSPDLDRTLRALDLGASDLYLSTLEGPGTLAARLRHTIRSNEREQLYAHLFATLFANSNLVDAELIELLQELAPHALHWHIDTGESGSKNEQEEPSTGSTVLQGLALSHPSSRSRGIARHDRREHGRMSADLLVVVSSSEGLELGRGRLQNLSKRAVFVRLRETVKVDAEVHLEVSWLTRGTDQFCSLDGRVVRSVVHKPDPDLLSGNAILVHPDSVAALLALMEEMPKGLSQ